MVALMELAAARVLVPLLEPGELSVGVSIDARHTAATPAGAKVTARAVFRGMEASSIASTSRPSIPAARSAAPSRPRNHFGGTSTLGLGSESNSHPGARLVPRSLPQLA